MVRVRNLLPFKGMGCLFGCDLELPGPVTAQAHQAEAGYMATAPEDMLGHTDGTWPEYRCPGQIIHGPTL